MSKTVSDKLRAHLLSQGIEGIPANNSTLFDVMQDHGLLQPTPEGKAIWRATVTSNAGWSHSFTLLRLVPARIWERDETPEPFAGSVMVDSSAENAGSVDASQTTAAATGATSETTTKPSTAPVVPNGLATEPQRHADRADARTSAMEELLSLFDPESASPSSIEAVSRTADAARTATVAMSEQTRAPATSSLSATPSGEHFVAWLTHGIQSHKLIINDAKALVHTVSDTAYLISPGLFQRYAQEHPQVQALAKPDDVPDWRWVQKRFEKLQTHRRQPSGLNIWTCEITGPRKSKRLHGYLLDDPRRIFDTIPPNNPYLSIVRADGAGTS